MLIVWKTRPDTEKESVGVPPRTQVSSPERRGHTWRMSSIWRSINVGAFLHNLCT
jgi:hypothetical protein